MAVLSSILLLGSILLSYAENGYALAITPTGTQTITAVPQVVMESGMSSHETTTPGARPTDVPTLTFTPNTVCTPSAGFVPYYIQPGDTLPGLARKYATSKQAILKANCLEIAGLSSISLVAGSVLYVPEIPPTIAVSFCIGAPYGWSIYYVKSGDTLFSLALVTRVTVSELQAANCLGNSTYIKTGQMFHLPFIPYSPPVYTAVFPPTVTPSATASPTASRTPPISPSWTPVTPATNAGAASPVAPSATSSASPTASPSPTASDIPVFQPPSTSTPLPTATDTPVPPPTNTPIPPPSDTPVPPPSDTPIPPPSDTPVPPPSDTPVSAPREITPSVPAATESVGLYLNLLSWAFLKF